MLFAHVLALAIWLHQAHEVKAPTGCYTNADFTIMDCSERAGKSTVQQPHMVCHAALVWPHDDLSGEGQQVRVCWVEDDK